MLKILRKWVEFYNGPSLKADYWADRSNGGILPEYNTDRQLDREYKKREARENQQFQYLLQWLAKRRKK